MLCVSRLLVTVLSGAVAAVPSASVMVLIMVCQAVNIPISDRIGLLMMAEWLKCVLITV